MKNDTGIVTASNSKSMNAVEKPKLFAAAVNTTEAGISLPGEMPVQIPLTTDPPPQNKKPKKKRDR